MPLEPPPDRLTLEPDDFTSLPGWAKDDHGVALGAFMRSCEKIEGRAASQSSGDELGPWQRVCAAARSIDASDNTAARRYFEANFLPYSVGNRGATAGLFTGYFEPELSGSLRPSEHYLVPLYARPRDLVTVELGRFREEFKGERIAGRVEKGVLVPYHTRAEIDRGALGDSSRVLAWVDNPIDAFFLHVQGSGRIRLPDGSKRRIAYAAANGHAYHAIGRSLIERGALEADKVSMQSIRAWLDGHPDEAPALMQENGSFVFFRWLDQGDAELGPVGAQGVPLTPSRSLAIDTRFLPLGAPVWLETTVPVANLAEPDQALRRLLVAQDTGSAIQGPVRGDVFWGSGAAAGEIAGRMKQRGRYWVLLPRDLDASALLD